ncbi:MAG: hypothetical protein ABI451_07250 [Dokdonella sp.]
MLRCSTFIVCFLMAPLTAFGQSATDYSLNDGRVRFSVAPDWLQIMEKKDGAMQAMIFQVPDTTAVGTDDTASVTVKTHAIKNESEFTAIVQDEYLRSKEQSGYERDGAAGDSNQHRYFVTRGATRYLIRDSFLLVPGVAVHIRCQRPLISSTPAAWNTAFDSACAKMVASTKSGA